MEQVLIHQNPHWQGKKYKELFSREILHSLLQKCKTKHIQVLTGIRRCGKSSLFRLLINELLKTNSPKSILFINLDDPVFFETWNKPAFLYNIVETAEKITGVKVKFLFLDEIQSVVGWEKFVKSVYDSSLFKKIFVTGSNSSLLQNDFSTLLSGRYFCNTVYPLSFKEILDINNIKDNYDKARKKTKVLSLLDECLEWGAFPEIWQIKNHSVRLELLKNYFESIVMRDCVAYHKIADIATFKRFLLFIMSNLGSPFSYKSLAKAVASNENTIKKYLYILSDSYIISDVLNFSNSQKEIARNLHKLYSIDNGIAKALSYRFAESKGKFLENFVFSELNKIPHSEVFFCRNLNECDFIFRRGKEICGIQVCYELNAENRDREISGFASLAKSVKLDRKVILTYNQSEKIGDVEILPAWEWLAEIPTPQHPFR
ncbi:MAG: ATP-binding protein [Fibromonadaceae bacterium]|jgi:predicted AAA+ superfamily ATPase|nr:ATP-binding protein [Fibromonadaceae bacterium]